MDQLEQYAANAAAFDEALRLLFWSGVGALGLLLSGLVLLALRLRR